MTIRPKLRFAILVRDGFAEKRLLAEDPTPELAAMLTNEGGSS